MFFNTHGGSRTDVMIKLVMVFFISLLSFSVGTFVGKQFSDSQHKMAQLENEVDEHDSSRETASIPSDVAEVKPNEILTEEDVAKLSEEFTKSETAPPSEAPAHPADTHSETAQAPAHARTPAAADKKAVAVEAPKKSEGIDAKTAAALKDVQKVATQIAEGKSLPTPEAPKAAPALPSIAEGTIGKYTIQVSAHVTEEEAVKRAEGLRAKGFGNVGYYSAVVNGKTWYRVNIGKFTTRDEANQYRTKIVKDGSVPAAIVQQIVR